MMTSKETSYQKQKRLLKESEDRYKELYADFKKFYEGDPTTVLTYSVTFKMQDGFERMLWSGNPSIK